MFFSLKLHANFADRLRNPKILSQTPTKLSATGYMYMYMHTPRWQYKRDKVIGIL